MSNEILNLKANSKKFTKIIVLEIAYCSILFFVFKVFLIQNPLINWIFLTLLLTIPAACNVNLYIRYLNKNNTSAANNVVVIQLLILLFTCKFFINTISL